MKRVRKEAGKHFGSSGAPTKVIVFFSLCAVIVACIAVNAGLILVIRARNGKRFSQISQATLFS